MAVPFMEFGPGLDKKGESNLSTSVHHRELGSTENSWLLPRHPASCREGLFSPALS